MLLIIVGFHEIPSAKKNLQFLSNIKIHSHCLSHAASFWRCIVNVITACVRFIIIIINSHSQPPVRPSSIIQLTGLAGYDVVERDTLIILHTSEHTFGYCNPSWRLNNMVVKLCSGDFTKSYSICASCGNLFHVAKIQFWKENKRYFE